MHVNIDATEYTGIDIKASMNVLLIRVVVKTKIGPVRPFSKIGPDSVFFVVYHRDYLEDGRFLISSLQHT